MDCAVLSNREWGFSLFRRVNSAADLQYVSLMKNLEITKVIRPIAINIIKEDWYSLSDICCSFFA